MGERFSEMRMMANSDNVRDGSDSGLDCNFGFGFNNINFSDWLLQIEIFREPATFIPDPEDKSERVLVNSSSSFSKWDLDSVETKTLHVNSLLLAAKSTFFYELLTHAMKEPEKKIVTLQINASEETAVMEVLRFMYDNVISSTTAPATVDVLMAADKFEVDSCVKHCSRLLTSFPMSPESASFYLELPSRVLMAEAVRPLVDAAKRYLSTRYKDIVKYVDEIMPLPLAGVETIVSSDDLLVGSEDFVYKFVLEWARVKYPNLEERREILATRLSRCIRFPYLSCGKLKHVLECEDFDHETASKLVLNAMFFKLAGEMSDSSDRQFVERAYLRRPVKIVKLELPRPQSVVYLDLKKTECSNLCHSNVVYSQVFELGERRLFLSAWYLMQKETNVQVFDVYLGSREERSECFAVEFEFAVRSKPTEEFSVSREGTCVFIRGNAFFPKKVFQIPWILLFGDDSVYFINGILHLRAVLTLRQ